MGHTSKQYAKAKGIFMVLSWVFGSLALTSATVSGMFAEDQIIGKKIENGTGKKVKDTEGNEYTVLNDDIL